MNLRSGLFAYVFFSLPLLAQPAAVPPPAAGEPLVTRRYILERPPVFGDRPAGLWGSAGGGGGAPFAGEPFGGPESATESSLPWAKRMATPDTMRAYFARHLDLSFPEGSWITYKEASNYLTMHNTEKNHAWLRFALIQAQALPSQVAITGRLVAFDTAELEKLDRESTTPLDDAALLSLWRKGRGETLGVQHFKTINGVNAIIESVDEVIYPTEIDTMVTNNVARLVFGGFETREEGLILNVTPVVSAGAQVINLVLLPEKSTLIGSNPQVPADSAAVTPTFQSFNITTSMIVRNGHTLVAGQSLSRDGKRRLVFFITAMLCDPEGGIIVAPEE
jgi:hypothetical protein